MSRELKFETLAAHAGQDYNDTFGSRGVPVYKLLHIYLEIQNMLLTYLI